MKENWFKDWFESDLYLSVYQHRDNDDANLLCNLILNSINLKPEAKILDAACGAGRHLINFSKHGFNAFGFDLSKSLLKVAKQNCFNNNITPNLFCSDLRNVKLKAEFDLITNLFTSFGYFENDTENFLFINSAYNLLKVNGFYILDYFNEEYLRKNLVPFSEKNVDGLKIKEHRFIENSRVVKNIELDNGERKLEFIESVKLYSFEDLMEQVDKIGFKYYNHFGSYTGEEFDKGKSQRLILFLKK